MIILGHSQLVSSILEQPPLSSHHHLFSFANSGADALQSASMNTRSAGSKKNDEMLRKGRSKQQRISTKISGGEVDDDAMIMVAVVVWMI